MNPVTMPSFLNASSKYQGVPDLIELGHTTSSEKLLYECISKEALAFIESNQNHESVSILDLCSASGGCAWHILQKDITCNHLVLIDIEASMCEAASRKFYDFLPEAEIIKNDAVTWKSPDKFDLILMNSAYHHIDDERKKLFLSNARRHLSKNGKIIVGEHFLPDYENNNLPSYQSAVVDFYTKRIQSLESHGDSQESIEIIKQTGRYCWERNYEYQVSHAIFLEHINASRLYIENETKVWPKKNEYISFPPNSGSFCLVLTHAI